MVLAEKKGLEAGLEQCLEQCLEKGRKEGRQEERVMLVKKMQMKSLFPALIKQAMGILV